MFVEAFGLRCDPFMDTADPAFYYETISCANGRRRLAQCLSSGRGLAVVVGPIGAGKTTLCNAVQHDVLLLPSVQAGLILDPTFEDEAEFLASVASSLSVQTDPSSGIRRIKDSLKRALFESIESGVQYALFIDEAQLLPETLLETLRSLLNYQVDERKLLAVALSGQMELSEAMARHPNLTDRVALWIELGPLAESEAAALLDHRLTRAGFAGARSPFSSESAKLAWRISSGLPRRLTALARESMEVAAERGARQVNAADMEAAAKRLPPTRDPVELRRPFAPAAPAPSDEPMSARPKWPWSWLAR